MVTHDPDENIPSARNPPGEHGLPCPMEKSHPAFQEIIHLSFKCVLERKALHFRHALLRLKEKGVMSYCVPSAQFLTR